MYKALLPYLIICALFFSCKNDFKEKNTLIKNIDSAAITLSKPKPIIVFHRAKQIFSEAQKPPRTPVGKPETKPTNTNVFPVNELTSVEASKDLKIITPGADTFPLPKIISITPKVVPCKRPVPVIALAPKIKDAAIYDIRYLDVDEGMISSEIKKVLVDNIGNIWLGTIGSGVTKYDGRTFLHFTEENGLSNNKILSIFQDHKGNLWFGTEGGGVCCYNGKNFLWLTEKEGLTNNIILSVYEDKQGNMWFGTNGSGVCKYDGDSLTSFKEEQGLSNNEVRCILQDKKGNMWFGTTYAGACIYDGKSFTWFGEDAGLNSTMIHAMYEDNNGSIYFATDEGGVNIYDGKTVKYITKKRGLSSNCIVSLHGDKAGNLWIGTYDSGLCKYDKKEITTFSTEQGLTNNYILSVAEDNSGGLWLATYGGGVCRLNNNSFKHYTEKEGFGSKSVRSIVEDKVGNLWLGTYGDGAIYYNGSSFIHYRDKSGLPDNKIIASVVDGDDVWFGISQAGAVRLKGNYFENFTKNSGLCGDDILSMCKDKEGKIWFGTNQEGICYYDGKQFGTLVEEPGINDSKIHSIIQDKSGNMWFSTDGLGACCFNGKYYKWYTKKAGLCNNIVNCIFEDLSGNIWFGTEGGISILKSESINSSLPQFETISEGLTNNKIRSIIQDKNGNIGVATACGLNYLGKRRNPKEISTYTAADGLKANIFYSGALIDSKKTIWYGNGTSLTFLNINNYVPPGSPPVVRLTNLELKKSFIDFYALKDSLRLGKDFIVGGKKLTGVQFDSVQNFYNYPKNLSLPYNINDVEFEFNAIDWSGANRIEYTYMLKGVDEDWSPPSSKNKAPYTNLSPGQYTFKVRAFGFKNRGSNVFEYSFSVRPPWYQTYWAYAMYVIAFFGIIIGFNNLRTRQLKLRQEELKKIVKERTAEVVEQKELIEEKQKEIVDSINYAKRIQNAMLASEKLFKNYLKNYFLLFVPKDIVSGDFYWASPMADDKFVLVTADSTGHGVPGAMMCMLNISCLNEAVNERQYLSPAAILNHARQRIISSLAEDGSEEGGKDGMDCSVVIFDFKNQKLSFAGANNPVWIIRDGELIELKPDKMPVGKHAKDNVPFSEQIIDLNPGDVVYTLTDGYCDQFGGKGTKSKKYTYRQLKENLLKIHVKPCNDQKTELHKAILDWKGSLEQVDDILIMGVKI